MKALSRWLLSAALVLGTPLPGEASELRQRTRLDQGWRFHPGDPPDTGNDLDYEVRPTIEHTADGKVADARPETAQEVAQARLVLRPWILPTANPLIADPSEHHRRPDGHPGSTLPFVQADFDDSDWTEVRVPHDWAIDGPFIAVGPYGGMGRLPSWGIGWYRRTLEIPSSSSERRYFLDVDGAMSYAAVWLNGELVGGWPYGYNGWRLDLTPHVRPGQSNQLAIRLDNPPESARWYPGGGLYRSVWLTHTAPVHVAHWGVQVRTPEVSARVARVELAVRVDNDGDQPAGIEVSTEIYRLDAEDRPVGQALAILPRKLVRIAPGVSATHTATARIKDPQRWGPPPTQQPHCHLAITRLYRDDVLIDQMETRFGIRSLRWDPQRGLLVNDEHIPLRGVNNHHDLGALGAAFNVRAAERQLQILQAMGSNAVRMAHNPPASELLDLTDRLGLLVIDEIFDSWAARKTPLDFHRVFNDWYEPDLRAMLRRDRNHPSVFLWSVGNEVGEQYTDAAGAAIARRLVQIVREEDPDRLTTTAMNWAKPDMPLPAEVDVIGLNYQGEGIRQEAEFEGTERIRTPPMYDAFHAAFPDKPIISTETASSLSTRGTYLFPVVDGISSPVRDGRGGDSQRRHVSAYELYAVDFGSSADRVFASLDAHPFVAGEFVWTGFDYLGEPTPYYDSRSSYSGIIDLAGFPKDRYYLYQARWRPELRMAHLLPHWDWPERVGDLTPVHLFSSGDEAELFLNGVSQGRLQRQARQYRFRWDGVRYTAGELQAKVWRHGQPWATETIHSTGTPARLEVASDRYALRNDAEDLAFLSIRALDAEGRPVPVADLPVHVSVSGAADLVALDNGDPTDLTPFPVATRRLFSGRLLAIVRGRPGASGEATVRAQADGLQEQVMTLDVGAESAATLREAFAGRFRMGVAVNQAIVSGEDALSQPLVPRHFNSITAENVMKAEVVNPTPGVYDFAAADAFVAYGQRHGLFVVGHTLVWHNQTPAWFFTDANGQPNTPAAQIERMRAHIEAVAGRYVGRVHAWDVVNEVIGEDGQYRPTSWVNAVGDGDELVRQAFALAARYAPDAELYYNDFNAWRPEKRAGIVRMVQMLQAAGIRIDGIGMQGHWGLNYPALSEIEASIDAYAALGLKVMITELDVDVLPLTREGQIIGTGLLHPQYQLPEFKRFLDPWPDGLPASVQQQLADRYAELFALFMRKHQQIDRVTLWGLHDGMSWKNGYPIEARTNYPLLFDRQRRAKPALEAVIKTATSTGEAR